MSNELTCCDIPLEFQLYGEGPELEGETWSAYLDFETAHCRECNAHYVRGQGKSNAYAEDEDDYVCTRDGRRILVVEVAHPIHDGPFPNSGFGGVHRESVPYCPDCDDKPSFYGTIIDKNTSAKLRAAMVERWGSHIVES